jgi:hypothetical protein
MFVRLWREAGGSVRGGGSIGGKGVCFGFGNLLSEK